MRAIGCVATAVSLLHCTITVAYYIMRRRATPQSSLPLSMVVKLGRRQSQQWPSWKGVANHLSRFESKKCAFVTLLIARSEQTGYSAFVESATRIREAFQLERAYPHLVLHEGNLDVAHQASLRSRVPWLSFINVSTVWGDAKNVPMRDATDRPLGYNHMCRFFAMQIFGVVHELGYAWIMRVDDDIFFLRRVAYDPFRLLFERPEAVYGYGVLNREEHEVTVATLQPWLVEWCKRRRLAFCEATAAEVFSHMYFNNLFAANVEWWLRDPGVRDLMQDVDQSAGIYRNRWGDAPLHTAALKLLIPGDNSSQRIIRFPEIAYIHFSTDNLVVDGYLQCLSCDDANAYLRSIIGTRDPRAIVAPDLEVLVAEHRPTWERDIAHIVAAASYDVGSSSDTLESALAELSGYAISKIALTLSIWCDGAGRVKNLELLPRTCCCHLAPFASSDEYRDLARAVAALMRDYKQDDAREPNAHVICPRVRDTCDEIFDKCAESAVITTSMASRMRAARTGCSPAIISQSTPPDDTADALRPVPNSRGFINSDFQFDASSAFKRSWASAADQSTTGHPQSNEAFVVANSAGARHVFSIAQFPSTSRRQDSRVAHI